MVEATVSRKVDAVGNISDCDDEGDNPADDGMEPKTMVANAGFGLGRPSSSDGRRGGNRVVAELVSSWKFFMSRRAARN